MRDPGTAQFLTRDPLESLTRQSYGYVGGNPLNASDAAGLAPWDGLVELGRGIKDLVDHAIHPLKPTTPRVRSQRAVIKKVNDNLPEISVGATVCAYACIEHSGNLLNPLDTHTRIGFGPAAFAGIGIGPGSNPPCEADQALVAYGPLTYSVQRSKDPTAPWQERYGAWEPGLSYGPSVGGGFVHWWTPGACSC